MKAKLGMLATAVLLASSICLLADTLKLKDGRKFEGKLVTRKKGEITFRVHVGGSQATMTFSEKDVYWLKEGKTKTPSPQGKEKKRNEVRKTPVAPDAPPIVKYKGPTYYRIPLKGVVGETIMAKLLHRSLRDAMARNPTVVVLELDSSGGSTKETEVIISVISRYKRKVPIVVLVEEALSSAAVLSLASDKIYMKRSSKIGAATSYMIRGGTFLRVPKDIEEKFQSVWRATARGAAQTGGHDPLIAEAMIDRQMELHYIKGKDGTCVIKTGKGPNMVAEKGKLLTMTSYEAKDCGLASGIADDHGELGKLMGYQGWSECKGIATLLPHYWVAMRKTFDGEMKRIAQQFQRNMERASPTFALRVNFRDS